MIDLSKFNCPQCGSSPKSINIAYDAVIKEEVATADRLPPQHGTNPLTYSVNCLNWHYYIIKVADL